MTLRRGRFRLRNRKVAVLSKRETCAGAVFWSGRVEGVSGFFTWNLDGRFGEPRSNSPWDIVRPA
jgi:hypothetical protein